MDTVIKFKSMAVPTVEDNLILYFKGKALISRWKPDIFKEVIECATTKVL